MTFERRPFGQILREAKISPKKRLGQHFMTDPRLLGSIASVIIPDNSWVAVEVGAGIGTLTRELCDRASWVYALEKDRDLEEAFYESAKGLKNLTWVWGDALEYDLTGNSARDAHPDAPLALCGNLPYYITSELLYSSLVKRSEWSRMGFVVQEEVGERMIAVPRSGDFGRLSLWCQYRADVKIERKISKGAFLPRPEVGSCLVTLSIQESFELTEEEEFVMDTLSRAAFSVRRKTLLNGLLPLYPDKPALESSIIACGINPNRRPEELGVEGFMRLARGLPPPPQPPP